MKLKIPVPASARATAKRVRPSTAVPGSGTVTGAGASARATNEKPWPAKTTTTKKTNKKKAAKKTPTDARGTALKKPTKTTTAVVAVRRPKLIWRTRDQENSMLYNLQLDVAHLQSELQGMHAYRALLMSRALNRPDDLDGSFARTVREYFRVFRHGYTPDHAQWQRPRAVLTLPSKSHRSTETIDGVATADEFLQRVMDESVAIGRFTGLAQMMKQWERYSSVLGPMTLSFMDSQILTTYRGAGEGQEQVLVTSRAQYHLYISLRTIENMFPHILQHHDIVTKILGRRISGVGKFDFVFNTNNNRIVRYEFSLDLTQSFIDLLGDPAMVAVLLNGALISDEFFIGDLSEFVPEQTDPDANSNSTPASVVTRVQEEQDKNEPGSIQDSSSDRVLQSRKMTFSNILSSMTGDDNGLDADVTMEEEPHAERAPEGSCHQGRFEVIWADVK